MTAAGRVKLYGVLAVTRRTYLRLQTVVAVLLVSLLAGSVWLRFRPPSTSDWHLAPEQEKLLRALLPNAVWLVLGLVVVEALETLLTLRKFAAAEARERAHPGP
jgi:hypothetical protein